MGRTKGLRTKEVKELGKIENGKGKKGVRCNRAARSATIVLKAWCRESRLAFLKLIVDIGTKFISCFGTDLQ